MEDRISAYPGRVKLTPVAGQPNVYDLVRADQPTQEGTKLNKSTLLADETAQAWAAGYPWPPSLKEVTPNDVLNRIAWLRGREGGLATLGADGKLLATQIPDGIGTLPWQYVTATDYGETTALDMAHNNYWIDCVSDGMSMQFEFALNSVSPNTTAVFTGLAGMPAYVRAAAGINITAARGQATLSGNTLTVTGSYGSIQSAIVLRFIPGASGGYTAITEPLLSGSGTINAAHIGVPNVQTSGTSINLTTYEYAFAATSKTATITSLPSSGVSNGIYFYGPAWDKGQPLSAGDTIKPTNNSGKTIQLNTAQSGMTYSGNVLTISPHAYRDDYCIGICLRFVRTGSYSRPFIVRQYQ